MTFNKEYFQQIFGIIMGTNLAPILANLYLAMLQEELKNKCKHDLKRCQILDKPIQWFKNNNEHR